MRVDSETAYVLHKRPYRESSLLLDIFSRLHGRIGLVARGARRQKSDYSLLLQPFRRLSISWSARSELGTVTAVETNGQSLELDTNAVIAGFYVNELIIRLVHRDEAHPDLFSAYETVLGMLNDQSNQQCGLRYFENSLLETVGYGLILDHDVISGKPLESSLLYQYVSERGPSADQMLGGDYVAVHGRTLLELQSRSLSTDTGLREAKQLLRQEIAHHLGNKPLASRALYQSYLRNCLNRH